MIRYAEAVLQGHPDKFSDQIADRIIEEAYSFDAEAYGQIEVSVWSNHIFLSGATATRKPFATPVRDLVVEVGRAIGYTRENHIDVAQYEIEDRVCWMTLDPTQWTRSVNDQAICIGWAGYDAHTRFLPPEHFLAHALRLALTGSLKAGALSGEGPDGKLLIRVCEDDGGWALEHVLCTLQQKPATHIIDLTERVARVIGAAYREVQRVDDRWCRPWRDVTLMVNPNGPLVNGGSDGDNGQTGRKLVMDYYGPRIPIGGGALSGKDFSHIDRAGSYAARQAALTAVCSGAKTCKVTLTYAPNCDAPLDVSYEMVGRGERLGADAFCHSRIRALKGEFHSAGRLGAGGHFYDLSLPWNQASDACESVPTDRVFQAECAL
jgi:S-adenosylmethionine synthetase